jgi:autotransporter-associated beta strand protein
LPGYSASDTWVPLDAGSSYAWDDPLNWASTTQFPNGIDDIASLDVNLSGAQTILLNSPITLGTLNLGDSSTAFFAQSIESGVAGSLNFDVSTGNAVLARRVAVNPGLNDTIRADIVLNDDLNVRLPHIASANGIILTGAIGGPGGLVLTNPAQPATAGSSVQILDLRNPGSSFNGGVTVGNGTLIFRGDALVSTDGGLGNSASAVRLGGAASVVGTGTPTFANNTVAELRLTASDDNTNYTFARDLDMTGTAGNGASSGRVRFSFFGDSTGGLNTNTLTITGNVILPEAETGNARGVEFFAARQGQTIRFAGQLSVGGGGTGATGTIYLGPGLPAAANVDGRAKGTYRFSDQTRTYTNNQQLTGGTVIVEGTVGVVGTPSPIGTQFFGLGDGNGGNMFSPNQDGPNRRLFLEVPDTSYARNLSPFGGNSTNLSTATNINGVAPGTFQPLYGNSGSVNIFNGYEFGGLNTSGKVTFSGNITGGGVNAPVTGSAAGAGGTNVLRVVNNIALSAVTGGTVEFSGVISGEGAPVPGSSTPGATSNAAKLTRISINQFRNHPNLDANVDGLPDANADALTGTPTGGTVLLSGASTYAGPTEVLGGILEIGGPAGSISGSSQVTITNASLKLSGSALDRLGDAAPLVLNTAAMMLDMDITESCGPLTVGSGPSSLDFGSGNSVLTFADSTASSWGGTLVVSNWGGTLTTGGGLDQLNFPAGGLTPIQLAAISFENPTGAAPGVYPALQLPSGEVIPNASGGPGPFTQWQQDNFGPDASNPVIAGPGADPDNDGLPNLLEYSLVGAPLSPVPAYLVTPGQSGPSMTLEFKRNTFHTDVTIRVQSSADLQAPWVDEAVSVNGAAFVTNAGTSITESGAGAVKSILFTKPNSASKCFLRIKLELQ